MDFEDWILGQDDFEQEELERSLPNDGPVIRLIEESISRRVQLFRRIFLIVFGMAIVGFCILVVQSID